MNDIINNYLVDKKIIINDISKNVYINKKIDIIYIINLKSNYLRAKYIEILMKKFNINYTLIQVEKPNDNIYKNVIKLSKPNSKLMNYGEVGCYLSHMWCLNDLIKNGYRKGIIFEDDIIIHKDFNILIKNVLDGVIYDFLMLGTADHAIKRNYELIKKNIYIPKFGPIMGTHAILYSSIGARCLFNYRLKYPVYFDKNLKEIFEFFGTNKTGICHPNLFTVENSTSNLGHDFGIRKYPYNDYYYKSCYIDFKFTDYHFIYLDLFSKNNIEYGEINNKSSEELIYSLLKNYFKNNIELVNYHYEKLSIDFINNDIIKELLYCCE